MDNQPMSPNGAPRPADIPTNAPAAPIQNAAPAAPAELNLSPDRKAMKARAKEAAKAARAQAAAPAPAPVAPAQVAAPAAPEAPKKPSLWQRMNSGTSTIDLIKAKIRGESTKSPEELLIKTVATQYEINLVPDVKMQMIRALKIRNLVLYICIVVSIVAASITAVAFSIKGGQDIAMFTQDNKLSTLSDKLNGFGDLNELVTIQGQLDKISDINDRKTMLSRVFGALDATKPNSVDDVLFSEIRVDLTTNAIRLEGQTNDNHGTGNDYRVLEEFKKAVGLAKYDYGHYVDAEGNEIPTWCISEADEAGNPYQEGESYYAIWDLTIDGCNGTARGINSLSEDSSRKDAELYFNTYDDYETENVTLSIEELSDYGVEFETNDEGESVPTSESLSAAKITKGTINGVTEYQISYPSKVKIWRTPQFRDWYNRDLMTLSGRVSGVAHFESQCIHYSGLVTGTNDDGTQSVRWSSENDCMLATDSGLTISSSSNGRDENDQLVLKFSANFTINEDFFLFKNKHMTAIGPTGQNVTDSYLQLGNMFARSATDCLAGDSECLNSTSSAGGNN